MAVIVFLWIFLALLVGASGTSRKIGFSHAFLLSVFLSPILGLIFVALSEKKSESLMKHKIAYDAGAITKEEYNKKVRKVNPSKEDHENMLLGCVVVIAIGLIIYLIASFF